MSRLIRGSVESTLFRSVSIKSAWAARPATTVRLLSYLSLVTCPTIFHATTRSCNLFDNDGTTKERWNARRSRKESAINLVSQFSFFAPSRFLLRGDISIQSCASHFVVKISCTNLFIRHLFSRILVEERRKLNEYEIRCCSNYRTHLLYHLLQTPVYYHRNKKLIIIWTFCKRRGLLTKRRGGEEARQRES